MSFTSASLQAAPTAIGVPKDAVVSLPNGRTVTMEQLQKMRGGASPIEEDATVFLGKPELLLANPTKGGHYGWPIRTPATQGKCRSKAYRKVSPSELDPDCPYPISRTGDDESGQVEWNNHILVEIADDHYQRHFVAPLWRGTEQLARLRERLATKASQLGLHITPEVTATPVTSY